PGARLLRGARAARMGPRRPGRALLPRSGQARQPDRGAEAGAQPDRLRALGLRRHGAAVVERDRQARDRPLRRGDTPRDPGGRARARRNRPARDLPRCGGPERDAPAGARGPARVPGTSERGPRPRRAVGARAASRLSTAACYLDRAVDRLLPFALVALTTVFTIV